MFKQRLGGPCSKVWKGSNTTEFAIYYQAFESTVRFLHRFLFFCYLLIIQNAIFKLRNNYTDNLLRNHFLTYWQVQKLGSSVTHNLLFTVSVSPIDLVLGCSLHCRPIHSYNSICILKSILFAYAISRVFPFVICEKKKD